MRILVCVSLLAVACTGKGTTQETGDSEPYEFCDALTDGGQYRIESGGGGTNSGDLWVRVLSGESSDPNEPLYVAFKDYTLENTDVGGVPTTGQTSGDGLVEVDNLGAGNWLFRATYSRGSSTCTAELAVPIQAASTTAGCPIMTCPD